MFCDRQKGWWWLLVLAVGCAHRSQREASTETLERTIESLRVQNAAYRRQIEELENRVFILTDQLDSRKVNDEKAATPELPRVVLQRSDRAPASNAEGPFEDEEDSGVEYVGEAAKSAAKRPVLRLYGDETPVFSSREEARPVLIAGEGARAEPRPAPAPRPPVVSPVDVYRRSLEALRGGRHDEAVAGFREFLQRHAAHDLADNAQYWLGECFYDRKDYAAAVREFRRVVERYPQGNKVPDALLKVGYSYLALGSTDAGRQSLEQLVRSYPRHAAAELAAARLAEIGGGATAAPQAPLPTNTANRSGRPAEEVP